MLTNVRQELIKKIALRDGEVIISRVATELGVSFETVRRDINALCKQNVLCKVHGGAVPIKITEYEGKYLKRKSTNMPVKKALGAYTVNLIRNSGVAFFSVGTTLEAVAAESAVLNTVNIITNSIPVSELFGNGLNAAGYPFKVIFAGGHLNTEEHFTFGTETKNQISRYRADVAVISAVGIDENGVMCASDDEGEIIAAMMKSADRVILVAESNKFSQKSVYRYASLNDIDEIVTDNLYPVPDGIMKVIKNNKITLHKVEV